MIIARRELTYTNEAGEVVAVPIRLYAPERNALDAKCRVVIEWPDQAEDRTIYGIDEIQAVLLGLQSIGTSIYCSSYHRTGRLFFDRLGTGCGFPVLDNARHLLIGDDKRSEG